MKIVVDAMGGDRAPFEIVNGALLALDEKIAQIVLVGDTEKINPLISKYASNNDLSVVHTSEYIHMDESPSQAIKKKKNASIIIAAELVKNGDACAVVSAGNTGAVMEVALFTIGRIQGIKRPALTTFWPSMQGTKIMLDTGANADCRAEYLYQFATMGSIYVQKIMGIEKPKVGLLNIGSEAIKGNALVLSAYKLLSKSNLNFVGNIEMREFLGGKVDVAVCDGFVGNMVLKAAESTAEFFNELLKGEIKKNILHTLTALALKTPFRNLKKRLDHSEHGGALLLGLKGICIKSHGRADARTIYNAVKIAARAVEKNIVVQIQDSISKDELEIF